MINQKKFKEWLIMKENLKNDILVISLILNDALNFLEKMGLLFDFVKDFDIPKKDVMKRLGDFLKYSEELNK